MASLQEAMDEYRAQLHKGAIQVAYKGLMDYFMELRTRMAKRLPDYFVSGIYYGYMDMTYFSVVPDSLKKCGLKIAVVFLHPDFRFEIWLSGYNRQIQARYSKTIQESAWDKYPLADPARNPDAILESVAAADPDFRDLPALTAQIETATLEFIRDIEIFLASQNPLA